MDSRPPLSRPRAETLPVEDLIEWAMQGRLRVPEFQRPLRWGARDVLELFDSVWLGYPVGNLLLWQHAVPGGEVSFGPVRTRVEPREDGLMVVDGQQRITALVGTLLHPHPSRASSDIFALWFDLEAQRFVRPGRDEHVRPTWLPLNRVLDAVQLGQWWAGSTELSGRDDLHRVALLLGRRIREYKLPIYAVESADAGPLKVIFGRANTAGVRMRETEVFTALNLVDGERRPLDVLGDVSRDAGMGRLEDQWLLRCLRAVAGEKLDRRSSREIGAYGAFLPSAQMALAAALDFLRDDCHVPHLRLLPYRLPAVVLARFFHLHPSPRPRSLVLLRRWFWRGTVTQRHKDTQNPHLRWVEKEITVDEGGSLDALIADCGVVSSEDIARTAARIARSNQSFSAAEVKLHAVLLASARPMRLDRPGEVEVGPLIDDAGPGALLRVATSRQDRILHPYLEAPAAALDAAPRDVQASHLWAPSADGVAARVGLVEEHFRQTLLAWCEPGMPDFASLTAAMDELGAE